jgi:hypothetical protein
MCKSFCGDFVCVNSCRVHYTSIYWVFEYSLHNRCLALACDSVLVSLQPSWNRCKGIRPWFTVKNTTIIFWKPAGSAR